MMIDGQILEGLTFDDVLLLPGKSSVLPTEVDTRTCFTRKIPINIPIVSAAMDTVTESRLAIAIARQGGIGFIHRNMPVDRQAEEVDRVKRSESGMIVDPVTIAPELSIRQALEIMTKYRISGLPVTRGPKLMGILTNRDLRFEKKLDQPVSATMTKENLVTVPVGTTLEEAEKILQKHRIEKLLVVDKDFHLKGLITVKDIQKKLEFPQAAKDDHGRLRVGAAIGATGDFLERAVEAARAKADLLAIDTAHGHQQLVMEAIRAVKKRLPEMQLAAGNVGTFEGARDLIALGVDGVKVGIGPGSICTTRVISGAGVPQITASMMAVICGTPAPLMTRVVQKEPGPMPTLTPSTPKAIRSRAPSNVPTLPAANCISGRRFFPARSASTTYRWWPWAVSMASKSALARAASTARSRKSPVAPMAAPTRKRPWSSFAACGNSSFF